MAVMITADDAVCENQWWKELFCLYAKPGLYFEIHCWSDEAEALSAACQYGNVACYNMPDIKIVHGILTERLIGCFLREERPADRSVYNKMIPFFTIRIGNNYSSENYGTQVLLQTDKSVCMDMIDKIIAGRADHVRLCCCD